MSRLLLFVTALFFTSVVNAQAIEKLKPSALPAALKFRGKPVEAVSWSDKLGENILLTTTLPPYTTESEDAGETVTAELFAYHYLKTDSGYRQLWRLNDLVKECPVDYAAGFLKGATTITDLDKDGICETTIIYKLACRGDVSPSSMKLIMHEDSVKYALRGQMWLAADGNEKAFDLTTANINLEKQVAGKSDPDNYLLGYGRYENEKSFGGAPPAFIIYARKQWLQFVKESFD